MIIIKAFKKINTILVKKNLKKNPVTKN
jgi:hypothetical protein